MSEFLWYWMRERYAIWERRGRGQPKPWTSDPILQRFRFCNVFRELDTVTIWINENIRKPFADHEDLWFMLAIARTINLPATLKELIESPDAWPAAKNFSPARMTRRNRRSPEPSNFRRHARTQNRPALAVCVEGSGGHALLLRLRPVQESAVL